MEQDDLGDWLSPLSRNSEAPPSPSPLAAPPGTPHAGAGAGAGLVHGSSATNDPAQPHAQQHTPTADQHGQWAVPERAAQHQGNPLIPGIAPVGAMPQPAAATAYGCGQPLPQYNLGSCAILYGGAAAVLDAHLCAAASAGHSAGTSGQQRLLRHRVWQHAKGYSPGTAHMHMHMPG